MSKSQLAFLADDARPMFEDEAKERRTATLKRGEKKPDKEIMPERDKGQARDEAGKAFGVSGRYVDEAAAVKQADPGLAQEVRAGKKTNHVTRRRWGV